MPLEGYPTLQGAVNFPASLILRQILARIGGWILLRSNFCCGLDMTSVPTCRLALRKYLLWRFGKTVSKLVDDGGRDHIGDLFFVIVNQDGYACPIRLR